MPQRKQVVGVRRQCSVKVFDGALRSTAKGVRPIAGSWTAQHVHDGLSTAFSRARDVTHPVITHLALRRASVCQRGRLSGLEPQRCVQVCDGGLSTQERIESIRQDHARHQCFHASSLNDRRSGERVLCGRLRIVSVWA